MVPIGPDSLVAVRGTYRSIAIQSAGVWVGLGVEHSTQPVSGRCIQDVFNKSAQVFTECVGWCTWRIYNDSSI